MNSHPLTSMAKYPEAIFKAKSKTIDAKNNKNIISQSWMIKSDSHLSWLLRLSWAISSCSAVPVWGTTFLLLQFLQTNNYSSSSQVIFLPSRITPTHPKPNLILVSRTQLLNSRITHASFPFPLAWCQIWSTKWSNVVYLLWTPACTCLCLVHCKTYHQWSRY